MTATGYTVTAESTSRPQILDHPQESGNTRTCKPESKTGSEGGGCRAEQLVTALTAEADLAEGGPRAALPSFCGSAPNFM